MEFTSVILFQGKLAHYNVFSLDGKSFEAKLFKFNGNRDGCPPGILKGICGGRHWRGNEEHQDLLDDIGYATKEHFKTREPAKVNQGSLPCNPVYAGIATTNLPIG